MNTYKQSWLVIAWLFAAGNSMNINGDTLSPLKVGTPPKVVGGYYPQWSRNPVSLRKIPLNYNVVYLFAALPVGGAPGTTGAVTWPGISNYPGVLKDDVQYVRTKQGRKIILTIGGSHSGMSFTPEKSKAFIESIQAIYTELGGIDGIDWDTFEGDQAPDTVEMIKISLALKALHPGFLITTPPAPWSMRDRAFCAAMVQAGVLDYAAPQYYDMDEKIEPSYIVKSVGEWVKLLGAEHVVVGFGINGENPLYSTKEGAVEAWKQIKKNYPNIRGAFDWNIATDCKEGWPFANGLAPLIK